MNKDREESSSKTKTPSKKRHSSGSVNKNIDAFLKKQSDVVAGLKAELQDSIAERQQLKCAIIEKNKCIQELQNKIEDRDNQIQKLKADLLAAKTENEKLFQDLYLIKEKYYELESNYDKACQNQNREIENLKRQLDKQMFSENQQLNELSSTCEELKHLLHERNQAFVQTNLDYSELLGKFENTQKEFERVQIDFENYRKQVSVEKNAYDERIKQDYALLKQEIAHKEEHFAEEVVKLKEDLSEKDEMIRQCIKDKEIVEEEKNHKIEELNYKIKQIEKVFGQPTKMIAPLSAIPNESHTVVPDKNSPQPSTSAAANVAITKPQIRRESLETNTTDYNSERQNQEVSSRSRSKKIPRQQNTTKSALNTSLSKMNAINRKRGFHGFKNPSPPSNNDVFSTPSSDDDDDDIVFPLWRPNNKTEHYVPETETDASESFSKAKRSKK